ncbi:MAG: protoheme IX farnesyltransferase [Opitutae bacterium]|nr:protoheme IX farnesyltransferase [Opitutae bacterium]
MSFVHSPTSASLGALDSTQRATWRDYLELTKPRLSLLSVLTALVGYLVARPYWDWSRTLFFLLGTAACAGGVAALNQWMEADLDARMRRTQDRPIPRGVIAPGSAFVFGWGLCLGGLAMLFTRVNGLSALLALATVIAYLAIYTPAKRWSRWSTEIGAVSGALPPLLGWAAAGRTNPDLGWTLFAVLYAWQMPHFFSLAWTYRKDYAAADFPMLSVVDPSGRRLAYRACAWTVLLVGASLAPVALGYATWFYGALAILLGGWMLRPALSILRPSERDRAARRLFFASIAYLPLVLTVLVLDRVWLQG